MKKFAVPILAACSLGASAAHAKDFPQWYAGASAGSARTSHDLVSNRESTIVNLASVSSDSDLYDTGWKIVGGWRFSRMVALEAYYADLGKHSLRSNIIGGEPPSPATFDLTHKISGFGADVVVSTPFYNDNFAVFGRAGAFASRLEADATIGGNIVFTNGDPSDSHRSLTLNKTVFHWGVGGEWNFRPDMAVRLEWERFHDIGKAFEIGGVGTTGQADTDLASIGFIYRF